jgi:polysaccharide pyruvyl transferase WcaK-like protein
MRILLDGSSHDLANVGDVAMLQMAIRRLSVLWPNAQIDVVTSAPERLATLCPTTYPVSAEGQQQWFGSYGHPRLGRRRVSAALRAAADTAAMVTRYRLPATSELITRARLRHNGQSETNLTKFLEALRTADLITISGGGFVTDAFAAYATRVLGTLRAGSARGIPTAMFGQGLGPITDSFLRNVSEKTFSKLDLLALRESVYSLPLAKNLGARSEAIVTTGDDAIEMSWEQRSDNFGNAIGLNLRSASYSGVGDAMLAALRPVIQRAIGPLGAPVIPIPISDHSIRSDLATVEQLLSGYSGSIARDDFLVSPSAVIQRVSRCRLVLTGSYHAAVFALSQGIPTVCIVGSDYYRSKFVGLAGQFGVGCSVAMTEDPDFGTKLLQIIEHAWTSAEIVRAPLREAAQRQIEASKAAYRRLYDAVEHRRAA